MKKCTHQTPRKDVAHFQQIKNIGPAIEEDFHRLELHGPQDLIGQDPLKLYQKICKVDQSFHDPCVLDCFISAVEYMNGKAPQNWWTYTANRRKKYAGDVQKLREQFKG